MKRFFTLLLALAMLSNLAACASDRGGSSRRRTVKTEATTEEYGLEEIIGLVDGQTYENAFIGIGCQLDNSWTVFSQEEAAQTLGLTGEVMEAEELLAQSGIFCDLYALYSDEVSSINIMVQAENAVTRDMSDEAYLDAALASLPVSLEAMGFANIQSQSGSMEFAGKNRGVLHLTADVNGSTIYEIHIPIRCGGYIFSITAASFNEDMTGQFLSNFYML